MTKIELIRPNHSKWLDSAEKIKDASWSAGKTLTLKMKGNKFEEWEGVIILEIEQKLAAFCTITKQDSLMNQDYGPYIGFVFVFEQFRENRLSQQCIDFAEKELKQSGFKECYIVSGEEGLYEKYGYKLLGNFTTKIGEVEQLFIKQL